MKKQIKFDVAFSFAERDAWVAKDLSCLLARLGLSTYCSAEKADQAYGQLRRELLNIYRASTLNVMIFSTEYDSKPKDSIVAMERKILFDRHVGKNQEESLFILVVDDISIPEEFDICLSQLVCKIGITGAEEFVSSRLKVLLQYESDSGYIYGHPVGAERTRGRIRPCNFFLADNWNSDSLGRWDSLGDIKVISEHELVNGMTPYLIPSANCVTFLAHSNNLRADRKCLEIKKKAGRAFAKKWKGKELSGVIFLIENNGMEYPTLYCSEYDEFLNRVWKQM